MDVRAPRLAGSRVAAALGAASIAAAALGAVTLAPAGPATAAPESLISAQAQAGVRVRLQVMTPDDFPTS